MAGHKIYDISLTIYPGMLTWPGQPQVAMDTIKSIAQGDSSNVSLLHIGTHTSTHVDAPYHFIPEAVGIDSISPEVLIGPVRLFQLPEIHHIDRNLLEGLELKGVERLLFGTTNSALLKQRQFVEDYIFISEDAASYLVNMGIKLVGVDYLSIDQYQNIARPAHHILLGAGVVIIEGLDLTGVPPGDYELLCLPLKIKDGNGAPARVFLREI